MTDDDLWTKDGREFGWTLPLPAARWKRLPVIRLVRAWAAYWKVEAHYDQVAWYAPRSGYDEWVIYAIQRGWC